MRLPGDDIVARPNMNSTRAITIRAAAEDIWPWLVQMGKGRGGLYSYDWLDIAFGILDRPSVSEILPQCQVLEPGDVIPIGCDDSTEDDFFVHVVEPNHALVLGANAQEFRDRVSWAMVLKQTSKARTRLIVRVRGDMDLSLRGIVAFALLDPASFVMLRKQMLNLKRFGERTRAERIAKARERKASTFT